MLKGIKEMGLAIGGSASKFGKILADGMKDVKENGLPKVPKDEIEAILNKRTLGLDGINEDKNKGMDKNKDKDENER